MHELLDEAAHELGLRGRLPGLKDAADYSANRIVFARGWLQGKLGGSHPHSDVVAFGSLARHEFTSASDFDYLVLSYGLDPDPRGPRNLLDTVDRLRREFALGQADSPAPEVRAPGATKLFGIALSAVDLSEHIGLDDDSNHNLTRRLMLLEESVSLLDPVKHHALIKSVLARYLIGYEDGIKPGVPRFLLNDVVRYWRTLAVDYQAKVWGGTSDGWGLRYLKLIVSRKLTYAGTLASLLLCSEKNPATADGLVEQFALPSLARLAQLHRHLVDAGDDPAPLRTVLTVAEAFVTSSSSEAWRASVKRATTLNEAKSIPEFVAMREHASALQNALQTIFFRTALFGEASERYLAF